DEGPDETEDARVARKGACCELRQLAIISRRQIVPDLADLFLDQVIVVEQPFGGRDHIEPGFELRGTAAIDREQHRCVVVQSGVERKNPGWPRRHRLGVGEAFRVLLQSLDAEQLFADWRGIIPRYRRSATADAAQEWGGEGPEIQLRQKLAGRPRWSASSASSSSPASSGNACRCVATTETAGVCSVLAVRR